MGIPLLGDEVYGGTKNMAMSLLRPRTSPSCHGELLKLVSGLERPCLHAFALGYIIKLSLSFTSHLIMWFALRLLLWIRRFTHPHTLDNIHFSRPPPPDFAEVLNQLREIGTEKVLAIQFIIHVQKLFTCLKSKCLNSNFWIVSNLACYMKTIPMLDSYLAYSIWT